VDNQMWNKRYDDATNGLLCKNFHDLLVKQTVQTLEALKSDDGNGYKLNAIRMCFVYKQDSNLSEVLKAISKYKTQYLELVKFMWENTQYKKIEKQESGASGPEKYTGYRKDTTDCLIFPKYIVWADSGLEADEGTFQIAPLEPKERSSEELKSLCENGPKNKKQIFDGYFSGLAGHYALGDHGTSAGVRGLTAVDIETGKQVLSTGYQSDGTLKFENDEIISFWQPDEEWFKVPRESRATCTEPNGESGFVNHRIKVNLKTGQKTKTSETKCFYEE